jgi:predicted acyltransferase
MILWAGGLSFLLLAFFYAVLDVGGIRWWSFPFVVIGANALLAYVLDPLVDQVSDKVVPALTKLLSLPDCSAPYLDLYGAFIEIGLLWPICWLLYRRRLFLRA